MRLPASGIRQEEFPRFNTEARSPISNYNITGSPNMNTLLSFALVLAWSLTLMAHKLIWSPASPMIYAMSAPITDNRIRRQINSATAAL